VPAKSESSPSDTQTGRVVFDLIADRSAFEEFDLKTEAAHGFGFAHLDQLAVEHLLGAR